MGVPLFQEQAMKIAMVSAGFSAGEADQLRRAMATFKRTGTIGTFRDRIINGMTERGYRAAFAEQVRSEERGVGKECVRTSGSRWTPSQYKHQASRTILRLTI